jgi:uncharacterized protein YcbX
VQPTPSVAWILVAPVKSMALVPCDAVEVGPDGIVGDRAFAVIDEQDRLINGKRAGRLATIRPTWDPASRRLRLVLPDGQIADDVVERGAPIAAWAFGEPRPAHVTVGPWSNALSTWAGRPVRLVEFAAGAAGPDRGPSVTLLSVAALRSLAAAGGDAMPLDPRRFRMSFGIDGVDAHAEDGWLGRRVRVGEAVVVPAGNVGRCAVTTHDPDTGRPSWDTLHVLQQTRGHLPTSEPLPFGIWAEVERAGTVRLGDPVVVEGGG